ncbi:kinase-like domain-containing protein [Rhizophagus diaphanus]|nr:kinase-like domain-containing protein [Rhizophagus diaphanus] [Rhizophagus sp. MUCL 43196]
MANSELKVIDNSNKWINQIEESIAKKQIKYYDYEHFSNIQEIGSGSFEKVYRANWKNSHNYLALKSVFDFNINAKEIINELELLREVDIHENILHFYGITTENQSDNTKKYLLVMEYADSGTLRNYLSERFEHLTWNDKLNLSLQLANAISCEEIMHLNLHSSNIWVHRNIIKLADFGLSKSIGESFNIQSNLFKIVTYIDPRIFNIKGDINSQYSLSKKSDVYSIGILFWELSSGRPPFCNKSYNVDLAMEILQGLREKPIFNTPEDYVKLYTECWNDEPDNRPTINQIVTKLNAITSDFQQNNSNADIQLFRSNSEISENIIYEKMSQIIQNFNKINIKEMEPLISSNLIINNFSMVINELTIFLENIDVRRKKHEIINYLNNHDVTSQEFYDWLLSNQGNSDSVFLHGIFNHFGIVTNIDKQKAFELYQNAANSGNAFGITSLGYCYSSGVGTSIDKQKAVELYQKAADLGIPRGINNLGTCYLNGFGTNVDRQKAFELFQKAANLGFTHGIFSLGYCYLNGFGTTYDRQKAFELYRSAANLGDSLAQYNLACMYESGVGVEVDINQAIYWYKKSAEQGEKDAKYKYNYLINK